MHFWFEIPLFLAGSVHCYVPAANRFQRLCTWSGLALEGATCVHVPAGERVLVHLLKLARTATRTSLRGLPPRSSRI